ncbi:MAG: V-type ATP synthase subunit D [Chlamydia sp.]
MADVKLTKTELKSQKNKLDQLQKYLPTLQLKKALLQAEVLNARQEKSALESERDRRMNAMQEASQLLSMSMPFTIDEAVSVESVQIEHENVAGAELPKLKSILFTPFEYDFYITKPWTDSLLQLVRLCVTSHISLDCAEKRLSLLEKELREVSIRVNLFEKVLIPRFKTNIKKIKVFLGDLQLAQVGQAKVAKEKIKRRRKEHMDQIEAVQHSLRASARGLPT